MEKQRYVQLESHAEDAIIKLIQACASLDIDNVSFDLDYDVSVYMRAYKPYWEVIVVKGEEQRDIYRIDKAQMNKLDYQYSEGDED